MSLALSGGLQNLPNKKSLLLAFTTGCFIAGYSLVDGHGARTAASPHSYMVWVTLMDVAPFTVFYSPYRRKPRKIGPDTLQKGAFAGVFA